MPFETRVVSAHRTPDLMADYAKGAAERGLLHLPTTDAARAFSAAHRL